MMQLGISLVKMQKKEGVLLRRFKGEKMQGREDAKKRRCNEETMQ